MRTVIFTLFSCLIAFGAVSQVNKQNRRIEYTTGEPVQLQQQDDNGRHQGLDYGLNGGFDFVLNAPQGDDGRPVVALTIGKRFNKNFYLGFEGSFIISKYHNWNQDNRLIPMMVAARAYYPFGGKVVPFNELKTGFVLNTEGGDAGETNYVGFGVSQGLEIELSKKFALDLSAGYGHLFRVDKDGGQGTNVSGMMLKIGFIIHR